MDENRTVRRLEHPLQNVDILEQVFKNLSLEDLLSSRQVCRVWLEGSGEAMRSCAHVQIDCKINVSAMSEFLDVAEASNKIFSRAPDVHRYSLIGLQTYNERFWTFCGRIKSLNLKSIRFPSADAFRHAIFQSCPKLEELDLLLVTVDGNPAQEPLEWVPPQFPKNENLKHLKLRSYDNLRISWIEIFSHFPSLQILDASEVYQNVDALFHSLALSRLHNAQCLDLKELGINFLAAKCPREFEKLFVQANVSLDSLMLRLFPEPDPHLVQTILRNQTANLRTLKLAEISTDENISLLTNNILFEKLTHLSITLSFFRSTSFLRCMPNLRKLVLSKVRPEFGIDAPEDNWSLDSCTELELDLKHFQIGHLSCLQKRLPNVEKLELWNCNNEMFRIVSEFWIRIISLHLTGGFVDDAGISGLDAEDIRRMNDDINWRPITVRRANLSSLRNLKSFSIYSYAEEVDMWTPKRLFNERSLQVNWSLSEYKWLWKL